MAIARAKMIGERFGGRSAATGGKGSMRRKKFYTSSYRHHYTAASRNYVEINRLMKKNSGSVIPNIESAYMMMDTGEVILFDSPKVELSTSANMCVLTGPSEKKHQNECIDELASFLIAMGNAANMEAAASKKLELVCSADFIGYDTSLLVEAVEQSYLQELYYGKVQLDPFGHVSNLTCCSA